MFNRRFEYIINYVTTMHNRFFKKTVDLIDRKIIHRTLKITGRLQKSICPKQVPLNYNHRI